MRHPTEGVLRRLVDDPVGVADADRRHVADCAACLAGLAAAQDDAARVQAALSTDVGNVDLDAAWARLTTAAAPVAPATDVTPLHERRARRLLQRPAAAAVAVAVVIAGAGTAAANDWLPIFRTEQVAAVAFSTDDLLTLPDLSAYGDLELSAEPAVRSVGDAEAAEEQTGLDLPQVPTLPRGIVGEPIYQLVPAVSATFTYSAEQAERAAAAAGAELPPPPPGLDGSSVRLDAGPAVAQIWTSGSGAPGLVVGRAAAPTAFSTGVPFETLRDHLLSLPGMPDQLASQLRAFSADGTTLPLPVPEQFVTTSTAQVDGQPATVLATRDRTLAAVVWVDDGAVTLVAGALDADELLTVARELR